MKKLLAVTIIFLLGLNSYASHIPGGNLTYQCTGNPNEYLVTMTLFVSCPSSLGTQYTVTTSNTCGLTNPTITLPQLGTEQEVSQICAAQQNQSDCPPGTGGIPGVMMYTYQALVTLPAGCNTWTFAFSLCCRDASTNTNGGTGNTMYFQTTMNSVTAPCDASPYVTAQPIPYVCAGQPQTYCPGAIDPDGDSLYYSLVNPMGANAVAITHPAPYSPTAPLQNFTLDPLTGCITFNQPTTGNFVVTYLIEAFDANGNLTGSIMHDFQFEVINCSNTTPAPPAGGVALISGNAVQTGPNTIELCEGATVCFSMTFTDPDVLDSLTIDTGTSNIFTALPGAIINVTGANPFTIDVCWTVPAGSPTQINATVTVTDGACPIEGTATQVATFNVITSTVAYSDTTICGNQTAQLSANGGSVFNWSVIAGPPMVVGTNFSCNPCANPVASPTATTTYEVVSNLSGGCDNKDTITVTVVPDFTATAFGDTLLCDYLTQQLGVNVNPAGAYNYQWIPPATLNNANIANPIASPTETTTYNVYVTSPLGCAKIDSATIIVNPPPSVTLVPGDTAICAGDGIQFDVSLTALDENFDPMDPSLFATNVGTTVGPPCVPFMGDALNFTAANRELSTQPMAVGSCTSIDFCIWIANSQSSVLGTGCENADPTENVELSYSINGGATWINITTYMSNDWDAGGPYANAWQCFSVPIPAGALTANTMFKWEQVGPYGATIDNWALDNISISCGGNTNYTYSWNPATGLSNPNINNPVATPATTTTYTVTLTDSTGCSVDRFQTITVAPAFTLALSQSAATTCKLEPVQLNATVNPAGPGYSYLWTPANFLDSDTIPNPLATITAAGTHTYVCTVTGPGGCVRVDSITITVAPAIVPDINILNNDTTIDCGDSVHINLDLGGGVPAVCGPAANNTCTGPTTQSTVGNGTTNIATNPTPYNGGARDGRIQMIYTAAELNAMGFVGGKITEIGFNVTQMGNGGYTGLTVSMMCTPQSDFTGSTTFLTGATQVYTVGATPASYTPVLGWNTHVLNTAYEWDGSSNLLVDVCFDNTGWGGSHRVSQTATPVARTIYATAFGAGSNGCTLTNATAAAQINRPDIRLTHCPTIPDPNDYSFSWVPNSNILTDTSQNPSLFPQQPTTYYVTVTDTAGGCTDTDSIEVTVICGTCYPPLPTPTNPTCKDGSDGKIVIDPVFVIGSEVQDFVWTDSITGAILQTTTGVTAGQDSLTGLPAGAYTITMTDSSGCTADTTVWLYEPDSVEITALTPDDIVCIGGNMPISASAIGGNGAPYALNWTDLSNNNPIPGNGPHNVSPTVSPTCYSVYALDPMGCTSDTQQVCISLYPNLIASTTNDSIYICPGASTNIDMNAIGGSGVGYNYDWYENNALIGNGASINVTPTNTPTHYIGVATDNCTTPSDSVNIYVFWYDLPTPSFVRNKPDSCYPITIEFTNTSTPANLIGSSSWYISDGSTINGDPVNHTFNTPVCQDVTLTVTTIDGCVVDTTYPSFVCPHDYPDANFYMTPPITDVLNTDIEFTNLSTTLPLTYLWEFNSGISPDTSTETHPTKVYPNEEPGTYEVVLTVTNQNGCQDTARGTVIINGIYLFYVPNTFTPDGDGVNEVFRPYGEGIDFSMYTMLIFDRWGELIYETANPERGWDGTYKGKQVPIGTYIWKIVAKEEYSTIIHDNFGHVNVIK